MPPTVKSLEERIDGMAEDLTDLKGQGLDLHHNVSAIIARLDIMNAQLSSATNALNTTQAQLAMAVARLDTVATSLNTTNTRLDANIARFDAHTTDFATFRGRSETTFNFIKWVGVFTAGVLVSVLGGTIMAARYAGNLEHSVDLQQKSIDEMKRDLNTLRKL